jgi:hypothetical protein
MTHAIILGWACGLAFALSFLAVRHAVRTYRVRANLHRVIRFMGERDRALYGSDAERAAWLNGRD